MKKAYQIVRIKTGEPNKLIGGPILNELTVKAIVMELNRDQIYTYSYITTTY